MTNIRGDRIASLYSAARARGWRSQAWSTVTGRSRGLISLAEVSASCAVGARQDAGLQTVAINCIRGSEARGNDFDCDFNPLRDHTGGRWLRLARARWDGCALPPVDLVKISDTFFVRDGHHRISVARAMGQRFIEAEVVVWHVSGAMPWEGAGSGTSRPSAERDTLTRVRDRVTALIRQIPLGIGACVAACRAALGERRTGRVQVTGA